MKKEISKTEAKQNIDIFFLKKSFTSKEMRKIRKLAMKYRIPLKDYKKQFCKSCLSKLEGKTRVSKTHKTRECKFCSYKNKFKIW